MNDVAEKPTSNKEVLTSYDSIGLSEIREIEQKAYDLIDGMREDAFAPDKTKRLELGFKLGDVADMVGVTTQTIRNAEKDGRLPAPVMDGNKRAPYSLDAINEIRRVLGTLPWRADNEEAVVVSIQNFKGGVGKSTTACQFSQYLALKGYRVCIIDADPQATTTTLFGFNPDYDINQEHTLIPYLQHGGEPTLEYALLETHWPGIHLIPANLDLFNAEYSLAKSLYGNPDALNKLRRGIETIEQYFDVIIIDPPPALGFISMSVIRAANALIAPIPPSVVDFTSSAHFFSMLRENLEVLEKYGIQSSFKFLKILITKMVENKPIQREIADAMTANFGNEVLKGIIKDSTAIDNATASLKTVYEVTPADLQKRVLEGGDELPPLMSREAYRRCIVYLNKAFEEIVWEMRKTWPSHHQQLRNEGLY